MIETVFKDICCPRCKQPVEKESINSEKYLPCNFCGMESQISVFPALYNFQRKEAVFPVVKTDSDAGCFVHEENKAVAHCDKCGKFLCSLCDIELSGKHICMPCLELDVKPGGAEIFKKSRVSLDGVALMLALLPFTILFWFTIIFSAPASLFISFRYWNSKNSALPRTKIRYITAIILSLLQISGIVVLSFYLINKFFN